MAEFDPLGFCAPGIPGLRPYEPGKPISELERELGITGIIKLASNENPLGTSPLALAAMRRSLEETALYPDGNAFALKRALADHHHTDIPHILVGTGSDHILELLARVFLCPGRSAVISRYGFSVYNIVSQAVGAEQLIAAANPPDHPTQAYGHNLDNMAALLRADTRVVFIANPNNPTGTWLGGVELKAFLKRVPQDTLVLVDEAYCEYATDLEPGYPDMTKLLPEFPNLIVMRTFSKAYGLAGARVGYALAHPKLIDLLNRARLAFNPGSLGQAGAAAAILDREHIQRTLELNRVELKKLDAGLKALGLKTIPSICNFVTADMGRPGRQVFQALLKEGVIVRPLDAYGLTNHLRITAGLPEQNVRLLRALAKVLKA
ncbi:MAG TPA: histidinol-phosphate transaminase [Gammaproteobacteria bacterium]|jgi:histidinol-phosphate aminotransferase|nr:histidinol-phosphate transaminase [Gammaproteobacteria bacterium]